MRGGAIKIVIAHFNILDENYMVTDPEPILMGKPCWFDAYMCCYMLNKIISYQILFGSFALITMI